MKSYKELNKELKEDMEYDDLFDIVQAWVDKNENKFSKMAKSGKGAAKLAVEIAKSSKAKLSSSDKKEIKDMVVDMAAELYNG